MDIHIVGVVGRRSGVQFAFGAMIAGFEQILAIGFKEFSTVSFRLENPVVKCIVSYLHFAFF